MQNMETRAVKERTREPWKAFQARQRSMVVKRDAVLRTAAHLFLEHGYQKSSMSLLAAQLKITKPALYYYFRNKEEILVECYRNGIAHIENLLKATPRLWTRLSERDEEFAQDLSQAVLVCHLDMIKALRGSRPLSV